MFQRLLAVGIAAGLIAVSVGACGEAEDEITNTIDCAQVCEQWNDCHGDSESLDVDIDECTDTCEDRADADDNFEEEIDDCEECLDDADNECGSCWAFCPGFPILLD